MADKDWTHRLHGDDLHDLVIFLVERDVIQKDGKLKPTRDFKKKYVSPCEPDVFFEIDAKLIEGNKRTNQKALYVVEVETRATNQSRLKKYQQYKEHLTGLTDLIVVDLDKEYIEWAGKNNIKDHIFERWDALREYVQERMPI